MKLYATEIEDDDPKEPEVTYTVSVPALPGCLTYEDAIGHALEMAKEAIELYIEERQERGEENPDDSETNKSQSDQSLSLKRYTLPCFQRFFPSRPVPSTT
jgi:predicted RNase H-like HicB family nuclease